jgi:hypothetical protein
VISNGKDSNFVAPLVNPAEGVQRTVQSTNCMSTILRVLAFAAALSSLAAAAQTETAVGPHDTIQGMWLAQASAGLDPRALSALQRISSGERRLLALRGYLRAGDTLAGRWSWSQEQLSRYAETSEGKAAAADIDAVAAAFAAANPGFTLHVNRDPRSLELQIAHWNANESVGTAAVALTASLERQFGVAMPSADQLRQALMDSTPSVPITLAAPGLSAHGQGRAFDFVVERDGQIIAGAEAASATERWDAVGWTQKLHAAVSAAGSHFIGPLQAPYEPWHYAYVPIQSRR